MTAPAVLSEHPQIPLWEILARAELHARRCPECEALPPNHGHGCSRRKMPDPAAPKHECGFPAGSLGCRLAHRRRT